MYVAELLHQIHPSTKDIVAATHRRMSKLVRDTLRSETGLKLRSTQKDEPDDLEGPGFLVQVAVDEVGFPERIGRL